MTFDLLGDLNWLAVLVAALAYFMLGAIWYAPPVMGKAWMKASGIEMSDTEGGPGPAEMLLPLLGYLVSAVAIAMIALATGSDTFSEGLVLGIVVGVGFSLTLAYVTAIFETTKPSPMGWAMITGAYNVLGLIIAAVIVSVWT